MRKLFCVTWLLAGCATNPTAVVERTQVVREAVPVAVACVTTADVEALPVTAMRRDADVRGLAAGAAVDVHALEELARRQRVMLLACAQAVGDPLPGSGNASNHPVGK
jgi:hypothetical protein